ncbi:hypothetical protein [Novipirellula artificiosorum]|uniref:Uncharacterized protein n=1 Tax=Novipirellula artificiosorum TaxID=2528016 RepID=A0A5C6DHG7_9BACT|nr:hypothetical protein [Novipirellula artificiosorum]TWU36098.1 hypothetical protein Poly41_38510 [Novipirellula artificiosorum]
MNDSSNPYVEARVSEAVTGPNDSATVVRPTGITVVGVLSILAGILGLLGSVGGVVNLIFGQKMASMFNQGMPQQDAQAEMQRELAAVVAKYMIPNVLILIVGAVLGACFLSGGIGVIRRKPWSRLLLRRTLFFAILCEVLRMILYGFTQLEMVPITRTYFERMAADQGGGAAAMAQFSGFAMLIGLAFYAVWALIKLGIMFWGRMYLNRSELDPYFTTESVG